MRPFVAPLDYYATVDSVRDLFLPFGAVDNVLIPPNHDRPWQRNRGSPSSICPTLPPRSAPSWD